MKAKMNLRLPSKHRHPGHPRVLRGRFRHQYICEIQDQDDLQRNEGLEYRTNQLGVEKSL
jgi:hypothetical protein